MFLSEWCEFPSAPCLAGKKNLDDSSRPWHASELVSFLVRLRTYQHPGTSCYRILIYEYVEQYSCWFIRLWKAVCYCKRRSSNIPYVFMTTVLYHHHHHHISFMELGHLLTLSGLTYPEVSSKVYHDSFCQLGSSVSLPWVIYEYFEAFYLHVVSSFSCIPVICPKLMLFLTALQFVLLFCNLSTINSGTTEL